MKKTLTFMAAATLVGATIVGVSMGQESTYLAQKLMLENDLRKRIESALSKVLDDHRYVLDLTVDLKFTPTVREEVTFKPSVEEEERPVVAEREARPTTPEEERERRSRVTGIPIPGFEFQIEEEEREEAEEPVVPEIEEAPAAPSRKGAQVISQSYTDITASVPMIEKIEISCILPEGSSPELIENVRQIIMVASHFDRSRGDVLSIMTASFKERRDERTAEAIILRSIAEKIDQLEENQSETDAKVADDWRQELESWKEEEARRREEERVVWRAELEKLENERLRRDFEEQRQALLERDSLRVVQLTNEINELRDALAAATMTEEEEQAAEDEVVAMEQEKAQLDSVIEEKLAMLQQAQQEVSRGDRGMSNLPIYLMSAISLLAVVALAAVIIFNGRRRPRYVMPPPWAMRPPRKKKVTKPKGEEPEGGEPKGAPPSPPPPPAAPPPPPEEDPAVLQSEIKSTRQSIVSAAVGEPETATGIVKEWLEEEAPPQAEEAAAPKEAPPAEPEEEEKGKKKKKKK